MKRRELGKERGERGSGCEEGERIKRDWGKAGIRVGEVWRGWWKGMKEI